LHYRSPGLVSPPERFIQAGRQVHVWEAGLRSPGSRGEETARISVGTAASWEPVRAWFREHYQVEAGLAVPELDPLSDRLRMRAGDRSDVVELLSDVSRRVRAGRQESGLSALVPDPPPKVWARGEGDCKDLVMLMSGVLARAGIPAWPVLWSPLALADENPNPHAFVHAFLGVANAGGVFPEFLLDPLSGLIHEPNDFAGHLLDLGPWPALPAGGPS
jgi:transglutaminase-like putative cysteine protease